MDTSPSIFLISTPQRCGSTWLVRMLREAACSQDIYVDGLALGFGLSAPRQPDAVEKIIEYIQSNFRVRVFKTHDVPSGDFDAVCDALPGLRVLTMHRDFRDTVVSRYFYLRYYWRTDPGLGELPPNFAGFLARIGSMLDHEALELLLETEIVCEWAREWAAFEKPFTTPNALRIAYSGLLDGSEFAQLANFTGLAVQNGKSFAEEQKAETRNFGREGRARFNRRGLVGEWREWWTEEQGGFLSSLADGQRSQQVTRSDSTHVSKVVT